MYLISPKHLIIADLFFKILSKYLISLRYTIQIPTTTLAILVKTENYIRFSHLLTFPEWIEFLLSTRGSHDLQYFHDSPSFMNHEYARFKNLFDCIGWHGRFFKSFKTVGYASTAALTHTLEGSRKRIVAGRAFTIGEGRRGDVTQSTRQLREKWAGSRGQEKNRHSTEGENSRRAATFRDAAVRISRWCPRKWWLPLEKLNFPLSVPGSPHDSRSSK